MRLIWKLAIPQILIVFCLGLVAYLTINSSFVNIREQYVSDVISNRFELITKQIEVAAQKSVNETAIFVELPVVAQAYEIAARGDIGDPYSPQSQEARELLRRELAAMLDSYYKVTGNRMQLHFHLPNGFSLVRLWREKQTRIGGEWVDISDDLRSFRPTVLDANISGEIAMGIEPGSGGFAIRGVIPVYAPDKRQIGSAEVLQDFNPVLELATEEGKIYISLYANKELVEISPELQDAERYPPKGDFIRIVEASDSAAEELISAELLSRGKRGSYFVNYDSMTLATYPLHDYRGYQVGVIVCAMNTKDINALANTASLIMTFMLAGMVITPIIALLFILRSMVTRPLNRIKSIIQDIAEDRADLSKKIPSRQKDEIGDLARWFNTLTAKLDGILNERQKMLVQIQTIKEQTENALRAEIAQEKEIIQTMKDNIDQGIFLMDKEFKILPQYSKPLISILSYYDDELTGKNFVDILTSSLDAKQLNIMKRYFLMMFKNAERSELLESANPISEFVYKMDDRKKILNTRFNLIEQQGSEPLIIGILQDITKQKEFDRELKKQKDAQELEMKNMFDVIQIDPMVFQDFIEDVEENFNYINSTLKDNSLTGKQVIEKFFQNVHAMKSNALILGLESLGKKLHALEDDINKISDQDKVEPEDILSLAVVLEVIMQDKDNYIRLVERIKNFQNSNQLDTVLVSALNKAVEKVAGETNKKAKLIIEQLDINVLKTKLRRPIKDILFQCIRNSIYHGIETVDERIKKNKKPHGLLTVSVESIGGKAEITVSDDGCGFDWGRIKAKHLEMYPGSKDVSKNVLLSSIFSPKFSTSQETTTTAGRGIGLSLVKDIVQENNGTINVNSSESGLTLKFVFPLPA